MVPRSFSLLKGIFADTIAKSHAGRATRDALSYASGRLSVGDQSFDYSSLHLLAVGKAAHQQADAIFEVTEQTIASGLIVSNHTAAKASGAGISVIQAEHPTPGPGSFRAGAAALNFVERCSPNDLLVAAISGGTSSLLEVPAPGLTTDALVASHAALVDCGASIQEINTVRRALSSIKAGGLARRTACPILSLVVSDVAGNDPTLVGSGPTLLGPGSSGDPKEIVSKYGLDSQLPPEVLEAINNVDDVASASRPRDAAVIVASPETLHHHAGLTLEEHGFALHPTPPRTSKDDVDTVATHILQTLDVMRSIAERTGRALACVWVHEPTVRVTGSGYGGRSAHLALLVARGIAGQDGVSFLAAGSDGHDGATDAAGAIVDGATWELAPEPALALQSFDSGRIHKQLGTAIERQQTGTNLTDLAVLTIDPS